jgi:hypothetical protein
MLSTYAIPGNFDQVRNSPVIATLVAQWLMRQNLKPKGTGLNPVKGFYITLIQEARV